MFDNPFGKVGDPGQYVDATVQSPNFWKALVVPTHTIHPRPAAMCGEPTTTTEQLVDKIAQQNAKVHNAQDATQYLATLATVQIASRAQMPNYTTMVQHFLGTLQLPMAIYMLDYYLPMLSPNEGYNET